MHTEESTLRVVLVDDHDDRRNLMRLLVQGGRGRVEVIAEADGRDTALLRVAEQHPDVALLDIWMPVAEGLLIIGDLRRSFPRLGIVVCSFNLTPVTGQQALTAGADRCVAKPASRQTLLAALEAARSASGPSGAAGDAVPVASAAGAEA